MNDSFSHIDKKGQARMVDIAHKPQSLRTAKAEAVIKMKTSTLDRIQQGLKKGDALAAARIAGIMAAKRAADLIPLCHPIALDHISVDFTFGADRITIVAEAKTTAKTGVEMEALSAASIAALTIYDMAKSLDRAMVIESLRVLEKTGGSNQKRGETT